MWLSRKSCLLRSSADCCFGSNWVIGEVYHFMRWLCSSSLIRHVLISLVMKRNIFWMNRRMKLDGSFGLLTFLDCVGGYRSKVDLMSDCWRHTFNNQSVKQIPVIMSFLRSIALELINLSVIHTVKHFIMSNRIWRLVVLFGQITEHHFWWIICSCSLLPSIPSISSISLLIDPLGPRKMILCVAHFK